MLSYPEVATAQQPAAARKDTPKKTASKSKQIATKKDEIPPPENVDLVTADGVLLKATFFPGLKKNQSVPVILLHMFNGRRNDYRSLAPYLQSLGHAVLVPDLRGHGDSTRVRNVTRPLEADSMPPMAFAGMVVGDLEACKKFLMKKNNEGELNIEKLCIVGAEMGAVVAADYARLDWSWPPLATGKQGQDVNAVVLISPQWSFRRLQMKAAMASPAVRDHISVMIAVGKERSKNVREAKRLNSMFERYRPEPEKVTDQTLFYIPLATSLQGTKILDVPGLGLHQYIAKFIKLRLVDQTFPWKKRDSAL